MTALLEADGVTVRFGGLVALDGVSLAVPSVRSSASSARTAPGRRRASACSRGCSGRVTGGVLMDGADVTRASPQRRARPASRAPSSGSSCSPSSPCASTSSSRTAAASATSALPAPARLRSAPGARPYPGEVDAVDEILELLGLRRARSPRPPPCRSGPAVSSRSPARSRPNRAVLLLDEPSSGLDARRDGRLARSLGGSAPNVASRSCSSSTTSTWCSASPTGSRCSTSGRSSPRDTAGEIRESDAVQAAYLGTTT